MGGHYADFLPAEAMARIFGTVNPLPNLAPSWNVAPTLDAAVVRRHRETGTRHLDLLTWGLLPYWTKEPSKARRPFVRHRSLPQSIGRARTRAASAVLRTVENIVTALINRCLGLQRLAA